MVFQKTLIIPLLEEGQMLLCGQEQLMSTIEGKITLQVKLATQGDWSDSDNEVVLSVEVRATQDPCVASFRSRFAGGGSPVVNSGISGMSAWRRQSWAWNIASCA